MDSTGKVSLSDLIERITVYLQGGGTLVGVIFLLIMGVLTTIIVIQGMRRWIRQRTEAVVRTITSCQLRRRATLDDDVMAFFRQHDPVGWLRQLAAWKRQSRWLGPILYIQDLDERVDQVAEQLVAYLVVKEDELRMLPAELKRELYGALRQLAQVLPMGSITKLLSVLDQLGSLPTAFDYIPPDQVEERRSVRLRAADLREAYDRLQHVTDWPTLMRVLGHDETIGSEALGESELVQIEEVAQVLLVFDQADDDFTADLTPFLLAAHQRLGSDFRQAACIVDKFLVADGALLARLEALLMTELIVSFCEQPGWQAFVVRYGRNPFEVLDVSFLLEQTALTRRYMNLLATYQPASYAGEDLAERKVELIEAWKVIDDLKTAGLVG